MQKVFHHFVSSLNSKIVDIVFKELRQKFYFENVIIHFTVWTYCKDTVVLLEIKTEWSIMNDVYDDEEIAIVIIENFSNDIIFQGYWVPMVKIYKLHWSRKLLYS